MASKIAHHIPHNTFFSAQNVVSAIKIIYSFRIFSFECFLSGAIARLCIHTNTEIIA